MTPANYPITVRQGTSFNRTFKFYTDYAQMTTLDLTDYSVEAQVRLSWNKSLTVNLNAVITDTLDGVQITVLPQDTVKIAPDVYQWDMLLISPSGEVTKPILGNFTVEPTLTQL